VSPGSRPRWLWIAAGLWQAAIYSSLYQARTVAEALRARGLLATAVWAAFALTGAVIVVWAVRSRPGARVLGILAAGSGVLSVFLSGLTSPEERLHFIEYGVLAGLLHGALGERPAWIRAPAAALLAAAGGLADETIQFYLPNRVFDWRDVALNAVAGALVVSVLEGVRWVRRPSRRRSREGA
jgi:hypothetical protein